MLKLATTRFVASPGSGSVSLAKTLAVVKAADSVVVKPAPESGFATGGSLTEIAVTWVTELVLELEPSLTITVKTVVSPWPTGRRFGTGAKTSWRKAAWEFATLLAARE